MQIVVCIITFSLVFVVSSHERASSLSIVRTL